MWWREAALPAACIVEIIAPVLTHRPLSSSACAGGGSGGRQGGAAAQGEQGAAALPVNGKAQAWGGFVQYVRRMRRGVVEKGEAAAQQRVAGR